MSERASFIPQLVNLGDRSTWALRYGTTMLRVRGDSINREAERDLMRALAEQDQTRSIAGLSLEHGTASLDLLQILPQLTYVLIYSSSVADLQGLHGLASLERLVLQQERRRRGVANIIGHLPIRRLEMRLVPEDDSGFLTTCPRLENALLQNLRDERGEHLVSATLRVLRMGRGQLRDFSEARCPLLRTLDCEALSELESVEGVSALRVSLQSCRKLRDETIGQIRGLRSLRLAAHHPLEDLRFLETCIGLEEFVVEATRVSMNAINDFPVVRTLRKIALTVRSPKVLMELSQRMPWARVTDGSVVFEAGAPSALRGGDGLITMEY